MTHWCTGAPDGPAKPCCQQHDEDYSAQVPRAEADLKLYRCMKARGLWFRAPIYFFFVRALGWYFYRKAKKD